MVVTFQMGRRANSLMLPDHLASQLSIKQVVPPFSDFEISSYDKR